MEAYKMDPLFECLVAWVNTFETLNSGISAKISADFKDGILMMKCLNNIDSEHFNKEWMTKIKADTNENWRLKLLNLKKILQTLTDYYTEELNHPLTGFPMPNLNIILESTNTTEVDVELGHFLQLVLGCAVNCERKSEFIGKIMEMNEYTQHMLMTAIQDLMCKDRNLVRSPSSLSFSATHDEDINYQYKKAIIELSRVNELKEESDQKCKRLDKQCSEFQDEKMCLINELEMLKEKVEQKDNARIDPNNQINIQLKLQNRLDTLQEEFYKLESDKEKYRIQFETAKLEQDFLMEKNIEYKKLAHDSQLLKDELDILKHTSSKVEKLESTIESYKIKLEEMCDLKKQIKELEESNTRYLEKVIGLEEEVRKIVSLRSQIEMYKKKVADLHEQVLNDEMGFKKLEYECKSLKEDHMNAVLALRGEKDRVQIELDRVREQNEQLGLDSQAFSGNGKIDSADGASNAKDMDGPFSSVELVNIPTETKEKIIRLYHENKLLKSKQNDFNEEHLHLINIQYEDEKQRSSDLQARLNETNKSKIELECQFNDLKKKSKEMGGDADKEAAAVEELTNKLAQMQMKFNADSDSSNMSSMQMQDKNESLMNDLNELRESKDVELANKQIELEENQLKMKAYLEKAKIVIRSLDPSKMIVNSDTEVQYLRNSLVDKDKQIKQLTKENEQICASREQEENLMVSAWYNQGIAVNRRATDERMSTLGNSFLSQQRHLPSVLTGSPILNQKSNLKQISPINYKKKANSLNESVD